VTNVASWPRFRRMPGLGDVIDCAQLITDSVTAHVWGQTDNGGGLLKFNATIVGVCPAAVAEPSWINRIAAEMKHTTSDNY